MKYFIPTYNDEKFAMLNPVNSETNDISSDDYVDPGFIAQYKVDDSSDWPENELGDYHVSPLPVISNRLKEVLELFSLTNVHYVKAEINIGKEVIPNYWYLHVKQYIQCLDRENSEYKAFKDNSIMSFRRLVLDLKVLKQLPEIDRLLFRLEEDMMVYLWNEKLLKAIYKSFTPTGISFIPSEDWNSFVSFQ